MRSVEGHILFRVVKKFKCLHTRQHACRRHICYRLILADNNIYINIIFFPLYSTDSTAYQRDTSVSTNQICTADYKYCTMNYTLFKSIFSRGTVGYNYWFNVCHPDSSRDV